MKTRTLQAVFAAGALAIGSGAMAQNQAQRDVAPKANAAQAERERIQADTAAGTVSPQEQKQVYQALARAVEDATSGGKFNDLLNQFARGAANAGPATRPENANTAAGVVRTNPGGPGAETAASSAAAMTGAEFDSRVAQFRRDWKEKYHSDFKLQGNVDQVFTGAFAQINTSDLGDAARTAGAKIEPTEGVEKTATTRIPPDRGYANAKKPDDKTRIDSRAVVLIEASHGAPMATLAMVKSQDGQWKLDTPQGVDEQRLRASLARHLDMIEKDKANWPSDQNEAYRLVAHHVFLAIDDAGAGMMQGGSVVQPGANNNNTPDLRAPDRRK
jgi:hypothetical protein